MTFDYDVIVIGAGHAGCEAAAASAKMGASTCLLYTSLSVRTIPVDCGVAPRSVACQFAGRMDAV